MLYAMRWRKGVSIITLTKGWYKRWNVNDADLRRHCCAYLNNERANRPVELIFRRKGKQVQADWFPDPARRNNLSDENFCSTGGCSGGSCWWATDSFSSVGSDSYKLYRKRYLSRKREYSMSLALDLVFLYFALYFETLADFMWRRLTWASDPERLFHKYNR